MNSKKSTTKSQSAKSKVNKTEKNEIVFSDVLGISIYSMVCVSSFVLSILFLVLFLLTQNTNYLISILVFLVVGIGSLIYLFKISDKNKNGQTTNSSRNIVSWL